MSGPGRYLVCLFTNWPIMAIGDRAGRPIAIVSSGRVLACSDDANRLGVRPGQRRKQAEAACPELEVVAHDLASERRAFEPIVEVLETLGVEVALRDGGWAGLSTRGPARRLGGEGALAESIVGLVASALSGPRFLVEGDAAFSNALAGRGFRIGVADGPFAATLAARVGRIVDSEETASFLADHPIEELQRSELATALRRLGIRTLGEFAQLSEEMTLARFGLDGAAQRRLAMGVETASERTRRRSATYQVEERFDPPLEALDVVAFASRALAEGLCRALFDDGRSCSSIVIEAEMSEGDRLSRRWRHDGPWSAQLIVERLRWQLETWLTNRDRTSSSADSGAPRGIERVRLLADEAVPASGRQFGLWGRPPEGDERAVRAFARAQGLLGPNGVKRAFLVGGRGPSDRVRFVSFGDPAPPDGDRDAPWPGRLPSPNPTRVFDPPLAVELLDASGEVVRVGSNGEPSAEPAALREGEEVIEVTAWAGPWPVDELWWRRGSRRRRARLQVVTADGAGRLLAIERGAWGVEGRYD